LWTEAHAVLPDISGVIQDIQKKLLFLVLGKPPGQISWEFFSRYLGEGSSAERSLMEIHIADPEILRI
jgi:hypothetical protein